MMVRSLSERARGAGCAAAADRAGEALLPIGELILLPIGAQISVTCSDSCAFSSHFHKSRDARRSRVSAGMEDTTHSLPPPRPLRGTDCQPSRLARRVTVEMGVSPKRCAISLEDSSPRMSMSFPYSERGSQRYCSGAPFALSQSSTQGEWSVPFRVRRTVSTLTPRSFARDAHESLPFLLIISRLRQIYLALSAPRAMRCILFITSFFLRAAWLTSPQCGC